MAKTLIVNESENTRVPFLRGILTHSLQVAGLPFDDAYTLASTIRDSISDSAEVTSDELRASVVSLLRKDFGASVVQRYESPPVLPATILVRDPDGEVAPFSRAQHRRYLESSGLPPEEAAATTAKIYERLLQDGTREITSGQLGYLTYRCLRHDFGKSVAKRLLVWAEFLRSGRPMLLLIGGTIGCGKSTITSEISHRLDIVRTQSTDMLREVMRMMTPKRLLPVLHTSSFKAWQTLPFVQDEVPTDQLLIEGYQSQAELLAVPCEAVLQRALGERVSLILEGVHVQPSLVTHVPEDTDAIVICVMLAVLSPRELRRRLRGRSSRAPERRAKRYLNHFDAIWRLQSFLLSEADQYDVPIIPNDDKTKARQELISTIIHALSDEFGASPKKVFGVD